MTKQSDISEAARKQLLEQIERLIEKKDFEQLRQLLAASRSADVAEAVEVLDETARQILFDLLDSKEERLRVCIVLSVMPRHLLMRLICIIGNRPPDRFQFRLMVRLVEPRTNGMLFSAMMVILSSFAGFGITKGFFIVFIIICFIIQIILIGFIKTRRPVANI